jgi:predicted acyltransferase
MQDDPKLNKSTSSKMVEIQKSARIKSIDALRGFDMFWISGGDAFFITLFTFFGTPFFLGLAKQLDHPAWAGFHFYDIIFALFLFIVGLSLPFSISKRMERGESKKTLYYHIFKRTILLYLLGLVYNGLFNFDFETLRYTGVLHRIAITYMFASIIILNVRQKYLTVWALAITLYYWLVLLLVPVPGYSAYNLTPEGNLSAYLDNLYLPGSFCCYKFGDNEGILTHIPAVVNVLVGSLIGFRLIKNDSDKSKILSFLISGSALIGIALLWNLVLPINKYLWTGSFVALTCGISILGFCLLYWLIDVKGYTKWAFPFTVIGMNSITIYVVQGIFDFGIIAKIFIHGFYTQMGDFQLPFYEFCILAVKWLFLYFLYKKKIFLKV